MKEELISELPKAQNWIFILFLSCFFVYVQLLTRSMLFFAMLNDFFLAKGKQNIFYEGIGDEIVRKIFWFIPTIILFSIAIYCTLLHFSSLKFETNIQLFIDLGVISLCTTTYILYKFLLNILMGHIFFQKKDVLLWSNYFFSAFSLCGLCLFVPVLLMFFLESVYYFCFYFTLWCLFVTEILILNKSYVVFFHKKSVLHYFILYLYIQVVTPLCFFYKIVIHFTSV
ncbi:MAG: hypothetical protein Pg6B_07350 [Candidatus Azobacteroides pseudotrichonymphae]|jgi:hypothetical protein|nr:DUF4271 domain-containing protein [Bacteroidales bacterium OttesenSCG-928-I14]GMO36221.1 MAG: hypothetical protein Pg6B_07350 [Candidatus Azobacteroides pseudotrichonymphae]